MQGVSKLGVSFICLLFAIGVATYAWLAIQHYENYSLAVREYNQSRGGDYEPESLKFKTFGINRQMDIDQVDRLMEEASATIAGPFSKRAEDAGEGWERYMTYVLKYGYDNKSFGSEWIRVYFDGKNKPIKIWRVLFWKGNPDVDEEYILHNSSEGG